MVTNGATSATSYTIALAMRPIVQIGSNDCQRPTTGVPQLSCLSPVRLGCTLLGQHAVRYCMIFWVKQQDCGKWFSFLFDCLPVHITDGLVVVGEVNLPTESQRGNAGR